ncbi:hypothetical protein ASPBRDRAFT_258758 [Aspergillus brasiliensis CBS 101740]|uniref:Secreted protein n=1 Tax=Aspergillus brasiliensis (strain CBS 101740 / IMI 381727 / IBT 21946) TaxID=767769 RepID=A0A1L9V2S9_ASPBC|nr:hypothetical protein ASPBRDRAFT_258758 [Aspergillus brasiliensis CBS 101740]
MIIIIILFHYSIFLILAVSTPSPGLHYRSEQAFYGCQVNTNRCRQPRLCLCTDEIRGVDLHRASLVLSRNPPVRGPIRMGLGSFLTISFQFLQDGGGPSFSHLGTLRQFVTTHHHEPTPPQDGRIDRRATKCRAARRTLS